MKKNVTSADKLRFRSTKIMIPPLVSRVNLSHLVLHPILIVTVCGESSYKRLGLGKVHK